MDVVPDHINVSRAHIVPRVAQLILIHEPCAGNAAGCEDKHTCIHLEARMKDMVMPHPPCTT
jgi:hypothetical protein